MDEQQQKEVQTEAYRAILRKMLPGVPLPHTMGESLPGDPGALPPGQMYSSTRGISPFQRGLNKQLATRSRTKSALPTTAKRPIPGLPSGGADAMKA